MGRRHISVWLAAVCLALVPSLGRAANWVNVATNKDEHRLTADRALQWDETGTDDSGILQVEDGAMCDNIGSSDFKVSRTKPDGTILHTWITPVANGVDCTGATTCGSVELEPGTYVFTPLTTAGHAICYGEER